MGIGGGSAVVANTDCTLGRRQIRPREWRGQLSAQFLGLSKSTRSDENAINGSGKAFHCVPFVLTFG